MIHVQGCSVTCALQVYRTMLQYTPAVQPLSCDEAYFDLTGVPGDPMTIVSQIRAEIEAKTCCTASAGERGVDKFSFY